MKTTAACPSIAELRELIDGVASESERENLVEHLGTCSSCQVALEAAASGDSSLATTLLKQPSLPRPDSQSAYWSALRQAEMALTKAESDEYRTRGELALDFLDPPEDESYVGGLSHFRVLRVVGRGGMGVVLHATDTCLQRDVAIKVLDPELANDELARTRFCREARTAASISHENVVAIHQVEHDESKDLPFLVMELIAGESLEKRLEREGRLTLKEIVNVGLQTAAGLAAAHEKGLIHRDIKPANILLEKSGQRVKLTDFGLARSTEDLRLTRTGLVAGTPLYMSPEQARGDELDARSDLFSLGIVLYELAAGEPPFTGKTPLAVLKRLTEEQPRPLRERNQDLPEWFAHIVDRLLAKKPADRFQSAREVANTLEHFWALLRSSETVPCPKKKSAGLATSIALGIGAGLLTLLVGALAFVYFNPSGEKPADKIPPAVHVFKGNGGPLWSMALSRDGKTLVTGTDDGIVKLWDVDAGRVHWTLNAHKTPIWSLALSPRGDYLATGSDDGITKVWDLAKQREAFTLPKIGGVRALGFDADGQRIATGGRDGTVKIWEVAAVQEISKTEGHSSLVTAVAFSPNGKSIASASSDRSIKLWDAATGQLQLTLTGHESGVYSIAFSPRDRLLASGSWDATVRLWDLDSGSQIAKLVGHTQDVWSVAFSPDGKTLASTGEDQMVRIWDVESRKELQSFRGSAGAILNVRYSTAPGQLVAGAKDGTARLWDLGHLGRGK